ncbi:MAG: hypothetical protein N2117_09255 [Anaerolineales bacterium]|nr:hypothetical protein [Anaerolineales bacterium]MCX7755417.1 hypothetical protein [Anaerolineales bacterium]MDW8278605.1 hypothetical protein [Anaerolineales bacterium]
MKNVSVEKVLPIAFYLALIASLGIIGYLGLARRTDVSLLEGEPTASVVPVIPLGVCGQSNEPVCVLSTGYDAEGNLLISLKAALRPLPPVYGLLRAGMLEIRFDCQAVEAAPRVLYCLGPFDGNLAAVMFELYRAEDGVLISAGLLVPEERAYITPPPVVPVPTTVQNTATPTRTPVSYPAYPVYPAYP